MSKQTEPGNLNAGPVLTKKGVKMKSQARRIIVISLTLLFMLSSFPMPGETAERDETESWYDYDPAKWRSFSRDTDRTGVDDMIDDMIDDMTDGRIDEYMSDSVDSENTGFASFDIFVTYDFHPGEAEEENKGEDK